MTPPPEKTTGDRKSGEVVKLTAVANQPPPTPLPTQQKIEDLAETLDGMYPHAQAIFKIAERLEETQDEINRKRVIKDADKIIENFRCGGYGTYGITVRKDGYLTKLVKECDPSSWYDDNGEPPYAEVAKMVSILTGSFPTSNIPEPAIFGRVLMDDVMALKPSFLEMEATCRVLRKTKKFMPSVSEVVEELEKQKKLWDRRWDGYFYIENFYDDVCAAVDKEKAAKEAPSLP